MNTLGVTDTHTAPTAAQIAEIVGSVTVIFNPDNSVTLIPDVGKVNRLVQTMIWTLVAPEGTTFASTAIIFAGMAGVEGQPPPPLPQGFTAFTGTVTRLNEVQVQARFGTIIPRGNPMLQYRYDIWVDQGGGPIKIDTFFAAVDHVHNRLRKIDPDMENEPQP
jgi:hypothetical protein